MKNKFLGTLEIDPRVTLRIKQIQNVIEHYVEGKRWLGIQEGIPVDVTDEVNNDYAVLKAEYDITFNATLDAAKTAYPTADSFDIGDGVIYVWGE